MFPWCPGQEEFAFLTANLELMYDSQAAIRVLKKYPLLQLQADRPAVRRPQTHCFVTVPESQDPIKPELDSSSTDTMEFSMPFDTTKSGTCYAILNNKHIHFCVC